MLISKRRLVIPGLLAAVLTFSLAAGQAQAQQRGCQRQNGLSQIGQTQRLRGGMSLMPLGSLQSQQLTTSQSPQLLLLLQQLAALQQQQQLAALQQQQLAVLLQQLAAVQQGLPPLQQQQLNALLQQRLLNGR